MRPLNLEKIEIPSQLNFESESSKFLWTAVYYLLELNKFIISTCGQFIILLRSLKKIRLICYRNYFFSNWKSRSKLNRELFLKSRRNFISLSHLQDFALAVFQGRAVLWQEVIYRHHPQHHHYRMNGLAGLDGDLNS